VRRQRTFCRIVFYAPATRRAIQAPQRELKKGCRARERSISLRRLLVSSLGGGEKSRDWYSAEMEKGKGHKRNIGEASEILEESCENSDRQKAGGASIKEKKKKRSVVLRENPMPRKSKL